MGFIVIVCSLRFISYQATMVKENAEFSEVGTFLDESSQKRTMQ